MGAALPVCISKTENEITDIRHHCCTNSCFTDKISQRLQLCKSLSSFTIAYVADIIMDYLPNNKHRMTISGGELYHRYCYAANSLCLTWSKQFIHSNTPLKVLLFGDTNVGKTSLINNCTAFDTDFKANNPYLQSITMNNNQKIILDIDDYSQMTNEHCIRSGHVFLCCFAINSTESYANALKYVQKVRQCKVKHGYLNWAVLLVGTKCDLKKNESNKAKYVQSRAVIEQTRQWNIAYFETSALKRKNIDLLFEKSVLEYWVQSARRMSVRGSRLRKVAEPNMSLFVDRQGRR